VTLGAFEWPLSGVEVAATFGEYRNGGVFKGVELEVGNEPVHPVEEGTLLFVAEEKPRHNGALPNGLGNSIIVEHERGIRSVYGYLQDVPSRPRRWRVKRNEVLSYAGATGSTEGNALYLQIIDSEFGQVVNPLVSISSPEDGQDPVIGAVALEGEGRTPLPGDGAVPAGEYDITVEAYDLADHAEVFRPMAPFTLRVYINGEEKVGLRMESISTEDHRHSLTGSEGKSADEIYRDRWVYRIGSIRLTPGDARLEVLVSDYAGNEASRDFRLRVQ
jgi:hypothetical protein